MKFDLRESTVMLAGRSLPAVNLICPVDETDPDEPEKDRALGWPSASTKPASREYSDRDVYVPLENGLLVLLVESTVGLSIYLFSRVCERVSFPDEDWTWLPANVYLRQGELYSPGRRLVNPPGRHFWDRAEEDWALEHIDRLAGKSFTPPEGPEATLVRLDHWWKA